MPFPLTISGEIPLPRDDAEASDACDRIVSALERQGARTTVYYLPDISLHVPLFRGFRWNWDVVAALDRVDLRVAETAEGRALRYRLSMVRLVAIGTLGVGWVAFATLRQGLGLPGWAVVLMWAWLVGGNYVFTFVRAKHFFRRLVEHPAAGAPSVVDPLPERRNPIGFPPINGP